MRSSIILVHFDGSESTFPPNASLQLPNWILNASSVASAPYHLDSLRPGVAYVFKQQSALTGNLQYPAGLGYFWDGIRPEDGGTIHPTLAVAQAVSLTTAASAAGQPAPTHTINSSQDIAAQIDAIRWAVRKASPLGQPLISQLLRDVEPECHCESRHLATVGHFDHCQYIQWKRGRK